MYEIALSDDMKKVLSHDCMPYIKEVKSIINKNIHYLYRGMATPEQFFKKVARTDRIPTDSNPEWQTALDDEFQKELGVKPRSSGVFCSFTKRSGYGKTYIVFPVGNYKFVTSKLVYDLYLEEPMKSIDFEDKAKELVKRYTITNHLTDLIHNVKDKKNEIMLLCKEYYAAEIEYEEVLDEWIKNEI